jgi:hypothetical protein
MSPMNPRLLRPLATGFNPRSLSDLAIWFDATDRASLFTNDAQTTTVAADNDAVAVWRNKAGSVHPVQTVANNRPKWRSSSINSVPALEFDGTNDVLASDPAFDLADTKAITVFIVGRGASAAQSAGLCLGRNNSSFFTSGYGQIGNDGSTNNTIGRFYGIGANTLNYLARSISHTLTTNFIDVHRFSVSPAVEEAWVNGVSKTVTNRATGSGNMPVSDWLSQGTGSHKIWLGGGRDSLTSGNAATFWVTGVIGEVLLYTRTITTAERTRVQNYLSKKWGIALA